MKDFLGQTKLLRNEELWNMKTQNKKQNHHSVRCSSSPRFVFYLNNFPKKTKKNQKVTKNKKNREKETIVGGWTKQVYIDAWTKWALIYKPRHTAC